MKIWRSDVTDSGRSALRVGVARMVSIMRTPSHSCPSSSGVSEAITSGPKLRRVSVR